MAQALRLYFQRSLQRDALCDRSPGSPLAAHGRQRKILLVRAKRGDETVISDHRDAEVVHVHRSASGKATDVVVAASHVPERGIVPVRTTHLAKPCQIVAALTDPIEHLNQIGTASGRENV